MQSKKHILKAVVGWTLVVLLALWLGYNCGWQMLVSSYGQHRWASLRPTPERTLKVTIGHLPGGPTESVYYNKKLVWVLGGPWLFCINGGLVVLWFALCRYYNVLTLRAKADAREDELDHRENEKRTGGVEQVTRSESRWRGFGFGFQIPGISRAMTSASQTKRFSNRSVALGVLGLLILMVLSFHFHSPPDKQQEARYEAAKVDAQTVIAPLLAKESRFASVRVSAWRGDDGCLLVHGAIQSEKDLRDLKQLIMATHPPVPVDLDIKIAGTGTTINGAW